ncbi:MAG: allantoate amidohydrolase [Nostocoides sp.]
MTSPVATFRSMWAELAPLGRDPRSGGYRRFAWTAEDETLRAWFAAQSAARGLSLVEDRAGNQWAWWGDPDAALAAGTPGIVTGSHLDSVPDGGAFDGPLGVVSALAAVDELRQRQVTPVRPIGVVNMVDEEGARFAVACAGSRIITGALDADRARGLTDADGVSMAQALRATGRDPQTLGPDPHTVARIGAFVELHIEQGRQLAALPVDAPVAVGSHIWPHGRWRIDVPGEANHAGTTRLEDRRDAMLGQAATVIAARRAAQERGCVATIGKVAVAPGGVNAIASHVTAWLDARGADADAVRGLVNYVGEVAADFDGVLSEESWTPTTAFDPDLVNRVAAVLSSEVSISRGEVAGPKAYEDAVHADKTDEFGAGPAAGSVPVIGTGAGHDAGIFANAGVPSVMLFVRNPTGISHSPEEFATESDCLAGVRALADVLTDLSGER